VLRTWPPAISVKTTSRFSHRSETSVCTYSVSLHYSLPDKNKMASRFVPVTDKHIFVLNEAAVSLNTKKSQNVWLNSVCKAIL
jgi:hypothetical protein